MMLQHTYVFLAALLMVFARAFQQLNVQHHRMLWVPPASYVMAFTEFVIVINGYIHLGWTAALSSGTGAWVGCLLAMSFHKKLRRLFNG